MLTIALLVILHEFRVADAMINALNGFDLISESKYQVIFSVK